IELPPEVVPQQPEENEEENEEEDSEENEEENEEEENENEEEKEEPKDNTPVEKGYAETNISYNHAWDIVAPKLVNVSELPPQIAEAVSNNTVFMVERDAGQPAERKLIQLQYTNSEGFMPETIVAYRLDSDGEIELIIPSHYCEDSKMIRLIGLTGEYYMVATNDINFNDVAPGIWHHEAVSFAAARNLFSGMGRNSFEPQTNMTRAMFVAVLSRLDAADLSAYNRSTFIDVEIDSWYGSSIEWALQNGIIAPEMVLGFGLSYFNPTANITREEMAVIFANYLSKRDFPITTINAPQFDDLDEASSWARDSISNMRRHSIINGVGHNMYNPQGIATRAEVAQIYTNLVRAILGL
ncbi:MAG: S-layer homology domain-containing protein, partial [Defluviitaleaceae bacterium]|nr:S-layer homology domain-containing protein [Defluviitaleaceae bacterium]